MKKTFPVNINGRIYYIDEDAYTLLQSYLSQLRAAFPGEEGEEILSDIESRISELFDERVKDGANVIVLRNVNEVIEIMGRPEELGGETDRPGPSAETTETPPPLPGVLQQPPAPPVRKLYRDERHKVFGGVLAGLGQYMNWDVTVLRILTVVLALCTYFWPCVIIYMIAWLVIPPARTPREILEMQGRPVNLTTVGHTVMDSAAPAPPDTPGWGGGFSNFVNTGFQLMGKILLGFLAFIGGIVACVTVIIALALIAGMIVLFTTGSEGVLDPFDLSPLCPYTQGWGMALVMLAIALPMLALLWAGCTVFFKAPGASKATIVAGIVIEAIMIVAAIVLLNIKAPGMLSAILPMSTVVPVWMG